MELFIQGLDLAPQAFDLGFHLVGRHVVIGQPHFGEIGEAQFAGAGIGEFHHLGIILAHLGRIDRGAPVIPHHGEEFGITLRAHHHFQRVERDGRVVNLDRAGGIGRAHPRRKFSEALGIITARWGGEGDAGGQHGHLAAHVERQIGVAEAGGLAGLADLKLGRFRAHPADQIFGVLGDEIGIDPGRMGSEFTEIADLGFGLCQKLCCVLDRTGRSRRCFADDGCVAGDGVFLDICVGIIAARRQQGAEGDTGQKFGHGSFLPNLAARRAELSPSSSSGCRRQAG